VVRSAQSYDTGLMITFADRAALDAYQKNPTLSPSIFKCEHCARAMSDRRGTGHQTFSDPIRL
jgi:hypothetical protein